MSKNFKFHPDDYLISITFDDVITAVNCNEEIRDREAVIRVYKEILKEAMINAFSSLTDNMESVLKELNKE